MAVQKMIVASFVRHLSTRPIVQSNTNFPKPIKLEAGKEYKWCTCGQSAKQPLCDGAHRGSGFVPLKFTVKKTETALMCRCKNTSNPPYCDMSHFKVLQGNMVKRVVAPKCDTPKDKPLVAGRLPAYTPLTAGKTYMWCSCGASKTQPFCDNSHASSSLRPLTFTPEKTKARWLCLCKQTKNPPFCDATHLDVEIQIATEGKPL